MSHEVRTHVRTVNGKKVTVRSHTRDDDGAASQDDAADSWEHDDSDETGVAQRKRHAFEGRALRERQAAEAKYEVRGKRAPGARRRRKKNGWTRAKDHARKTRRLYRRHKVRAAGHLAMAGAWALAYGTRKAYRAVRVKLAGRRP